jgi:hypothetical protein
MSNQEIELETVEQEHHLVMGEALNRLRMNPDFKMVIMDGYLRDKQLASFSLLAVPQEKQAGRRPDIFEDMIAGSNLMFFFKMIDQFYQGAKDPVLSDEEEELMAANAGVVN